MIPATWSSAKWILRQHPVGDFDSERDAQLIVQEINLDLTRFAAAAVAAETTANNTAKCRALPPAAGSPRTRGNEQDTPYLRLRLYQLRGFSSRFHRAAAKSVPYA
jgi:hypothetical protein